MKVVIVSIAVLLTCFQSAFSQQYIPGTLGIGFDTPTPIMGHLQVKGPNSWDAPTQLRITNNATTFGRTHLILTGRFEDNNDAWLFGTMARNAIIFSQNASVANQNMGAAGTEQYSLQLEGNTNSLGFLSATNGNSPNMVLRQNGNIGLGTPSPDERLDIHQGNIRIRKSNSGFSNSFNDTKFIWLEGTSATTEAAIGYSAIGGGSSAISFVRGGSYDTEIRFYTNYYYNASTHGMAERMKIDHAGNVGIGTSNPGQYRLAVEGTIGARKVKVTSQPFWADFVFEPGYELPSLQETENFIKQHKHLPDIPSAQEVKENGLDLGEMNGKLLQKIEEQMLYIIEMNKKIELLTKEIQILKKK